MKKIQKFSLIAIFALNTFCPVKSEPIDSMVWALIKSKKPPIEISYRLNDNWQNPTMECGIGDVGNNWTLPLCVAMKLTAFKEELLIYCNDIESGNPEHLESGLRLFAAYGVGFSGNWDEHWSSEYIDSLIFPAVMKQLKKPEIRMAVWNFVEPALKHQLKSMQMKFKGVVVISFEYVAEYFKNYDPEKAKEWYEKDISTNEFAYRDYRGNTNPSRKITALIERLMFKWKIMEYRNVISWIDFVGNWLRKTLGRDYNKSKQYWGK